MASGTSLSEYVLSITGVIVAASTSCFRNCRSALFGCNDHAQPVAHERRRHERSNRTIHASDPPTTPFAADEHERPTEGEGAPELRQRAVPTHVEDQVIPLPASGEVLFCVADDVVSADGADRVHLRRAAHAGHLGAERF